MQILTKHGFSEIRRRGSHIVMQKRTEESTITVPVPDHSEVRIGTLQSIIRQSQLPRSLFEDIRILILLTKSRFEIIQRHFLTISKSWNAEIEFCCETACCLHRYF
jgi:predicted RNA binding protein YcfA (HicA-like mRNA interferase family)